jgi:hypothetical protein
VAGIGLGLGLFVVHRLRCRFWVGLMCLWSGIGLGLGLDLCFGRRLGFGLGSISLGCALALIRLGQNRIQADVNHYL